MLTAFKLWAPAILLVSGAPDFHGNGHHDVPHYANTSSCTTTAVGHPTLTSVSTVVISYTTTTPCSSSSSETVAPSKSKSYYPTSSAKPTTVVVPTTKTKTYYTTSSAKPTTVVVPTTKTETPCTTTSVKPTTVVVPTTKTSLTTITIHTTTKPTITPTPTYTPTYIPPPVGSCAASCNVSAGTVNLFFWPTTNTYSYPSTFVDTKLGYTFTSPSVYMIINTINGYNSASQIVGPTGTSVIFALDLTEVSTIVSGTATVQLSLSDLGTDCPQTAAASEILTMTNSRCDPILAAPSKVSSWAQPCNACGRFGLFDPPYAAPTLTGGLLEPTTTTVPAVPITTPSAPASTPAPTIVPPTTPIVPPTTRTTSQAAPTIVPSTSSTTPLPSTSSTTPSATTSAQAAPAARATADLASLLLNVFGIGFLAMV